MNEMADASPRDEQAGTVPISRELATFMPCRYSPTPFRITEDMTSEFRTLGRVLLEFYAAQDKLYFDSINGRAPEWVARYLDNGKPDEILRVGRAKAFHHALPPIIRPDILLSAGRLAICELDSVPGGFGLTARMADCYRRHGHSVVGDISIEEGFLRAVHGNQINQSGSLVIVVSDESRDYLDEMVWLAETMRGTGHSVHVVHPRDLTYTERGASLSVGGTSISANVVYRFMELFDYQQISKWELLIFLAKAKQLQLTPPPKPHLEEKLWFALFHHPVLEVHWKRILGEGSFGYLRNVIPQTWIMDPSPIPPHATIPGLVFDNAPVQSWTELHSLTQKQRKMVIKPSGFSSDAWGSRGVVIGHDVNREEWCRTVDRAIGSFPATTSIIQKYVAPDRVELVASNKLGDAIERVEGRVRITPYYFVVDGEALLSNILVTHCSKEKKKIHGMSDAVMTVCST